MKQVWLLVAVAMLFSASAGSEIFKWVDKDGNVYYSDLPPSGVDAELIKPLPTPRKGDIIRTQVRTNLLIEQQKASVELRAQEREEKRLQRAIDAQQVADIENLCFSARQSLDALQMPRPVFSIDAKGERVYVDDELRYSEIARMKSIIAINC